LLVADAAVSGQQDRLIASNHNKPYAGFWSVEKDKFKQ
jgi:hypothetical protein